MKTNTVVNLLAVVNLLILLAAAVAANLVDDAAPAPTASASVSHSMQHDGAQSNTAVAHSRVRHVALIL